MRISIFGLTTTFLVLSQFSAVAAQIDLAPATTDIRLYANNGLVNDEITNFGSYSFSTTGASGNGFAVGQPFTWAEASVSTGEINSNAGFVSTISYEFSVVGPPGLVPIEITYNQAVNKSSNSNASASLVDASTTIQGGYVSDGTAFRDYITTADNGSEYTHTIDRNGSETTKTNCCGFFIDTLKYQIPSQSIGYISLSAVASAGTGSDGKHEYAFASNDPYIVIDPSFADASLYSIVVSPGAGNTLPTSVSTVPLPASAPMFGASVLALGIVGYGLKRRKAVATG